MNESAQVTSRDDSLKISILELKEGEALSVEIRNDGADTIRLWKTTTSWGWDNWRVVVIRGSSTFLIQRNPKEVFTRNFPASEPLPPHKKKIEILNVNDGDWWCNDERGFHFQSDDEIMVIFSVPVTAESKSLNVWTGVEMAYYAKKPG